MSYCRFSSDNFKSDVYCYESCYGGFTIHIAGNKKKYRPIPDIPWSKLPRFGSKLIGRELVYPSKTKEVMAKIVFGLAMHWHRLHIWSVGVIPNVPLNLPHDGETMQADDAGECAKILIMLRDLGYHVPQYAIDTLIEESKENESRTDEV